MCTFSAGLVVKDTLFSAGGRSSLQRQGVEYYHIEMHSGILSSSLKYNQFIPFNLGS